MFRSADVDTGTDGGRVPPRAGESEIPTGGSTDDTPYSVLLLVSHHRNRTLLTDWLGEQPDYEYIDGLAVLERTRARDHPADGGDELSAETDGFEAGDHADAWSETLDSEAIDLVLVDVSALGTHAGWLERRFEVERPLPLPCLLLASEKTATHFLSTTTENRLSHLVDDVLVTPIDSTLLDRRIRTYLNIRRQAAELHRRHDQLSLLAQVVRHDIANAATVVTGWGEILRSQIDDDADALERVLRAGQRIVEIVENSRDLTMLIDEGHEHEVETMPLGPVLDAEVDNIERIHESATKAVRVDVESPLPSVAVLAGGMLSSVFANLLSNAVRHNEADVVEISITVDVEPTTVVVRLADNGPGIPDEEKQQVFEPLTKRGESPGDGLGLSLVRRLVDSYDGRVWFEDAAGGGTVACVELRRPLTQIESSAD